MKGEKPITFDLSNPTKINLPENRSAGIPARECKIKNDRGESKSRHAGKDARAPA